MKYFGIILFSLYANYCFSQKKNDFAFLNHLLHKGNYAEMLFLTERDSSFFLPSQKDSLHFYTAWANYSLKKLEEASHSFLKVSESSVFYDQSRFFAAYNQTYLGQYSNARKILESLDTEDATKHSLKYFELSGISMLEGDKKQAENSFNKINPDIAVLNQQIQALQQIGIEKEKHRTKSAWIAGTMSGILPGSGKIYAGRTGEGIASMIATTGFGLIAWENYHKNGIKNFKTLLFGGIFVASYVSNIYGSVLSVKVSEQDYANALHNQILLQLHIPLRNFFEE